MSDSSAAILRRLFERYSADWKRQYPNAPRLSARKVSEWLSKADKHCLARWTNEDAHAGSHPNWRVPFYRVEQACEAVKATEDERDDLMMARIHEAIEHDPDGDLAVVLQWLEPFFAEFAARPVLSQTETVALAAFRKAEQMVPGAAQCPVTSTFEHNLEVVIKACFERAVKAYVAELAAETAADEALPVNEAALKAKLADITTKLAARRAEPVLSEVRQRIARRDAVRSLLVDARAKRRAFVKQRLKT